MKRNSTRFGLDGCERAGSGVRLRTLLRLKLQGRKKPTTHALSNPRRGPALIALPPGAVEPAGWLRDWCLAAKNGYTGHMDDVTEDFKHAWAAGLPDEG